MRGLKIAALVVLFFLILGGALWFLVGYSKASIDPMACSKNNLKVAAFGDSLVEGYGATPGHDFPSLLSKTLGVPVTNLGVNGNTTEDALARINDVLAAKPDVVIVLLGGNDALQKIPQTVTQQNLSYIVSALQNTGIRVVLVGVLGGFPNDPYASMFQQIEKQYTGIEYVPNILSGLIGNSSLMSDEVHPNDAGYVRVAARIAPAVEEACAHK